MSDDITILHNEATLHHGLALGTELPDTVRLDHALRACGAYEDLGDHWKARALDAESKVDGQAWVDLTAERDQFQELYENECEHRQRLEGGDWAAARRAVEAAYAVAAQDEGLVAAVDALNRGNPDGES